MSPLLILFVLYALSQHRYSGDLVSAPTGPDALANLQGQGQNLSQLGSSRNLTQTAFPTEWYASPKSTHNRIMLVWASDDPTSWAAFTVHPAPTLPTELARGRGPLTGKVVSALSRRVL